MSRSRASWYAVLVASLLALLFAVTLGVERASPVSVLPHSHLRGRVRTWLIHYRAHNGALRRVYVALPAWYGPRDNPLLPLVISPHGRSRTARANSALWGNLPAEGDFAVVNPEGQGRKLTLYSWGDPGQIADLAKMPQLVEHALPWLRIDSLRIYAIGASMGGQEGLLLLARDPYLLAGVAAFDAPTDLALRYRDFTRLRCDARCLRRWRDPLGEQMQQLARREIGGTPQTDPRAYALRSPDHYARRIAFSDVPLELWWSRDDNVVVDSADQAGRLYRQIKKLNPAAPVREVVGRWRHTADMNYKTKLPAALIGLGLLPLLPLPDTGYRTTLASADADARSEIPVSGKPIRDPARSYPWPLKPFHRQHPIRGGFGDPRTLFWLTNPSSTKPLGRFSFHNGVDIVGVPGTPVYPVVSGIVSEQRGDRIAVDAGNSRRFSYWHLRAAVRVGEWVRARKTVLGYIRPEWDHVHFAESDWGWLVNPLSHLTPYRDPTRPLVGDLIFRDRSGDQLSPLSLHGRVWITAAAYDLPWPSVPGLWHGLPVAPALLSWTLTSETGRVVIPDHVVVDFRHRLPPEYDFWRIYAHGSYQNFPVVGLHRFSRVPGAYLFKLTPNGLATRSLAPGSYLLTVRAADMGGNSDLRTERIRIRGAPSSGRTVRASPV